MTKIIKRADELQVDWKDLTAQYTQAMHEDAAALNTLRADLEPKATDHIEHIIDLIQKLLDKNVAYVLDGGDVYFRVDSCPDYGKLSGKKTEDLEAGSRVAVVEGKSSPFDFVLWKSAKPGEPAWEAPWGSGRPGWHIECSAMAAECLGPQIDIHGGGADLMFPHHENEIAQSECATGKTFAKYWLHNGFVQVGQQKMSKSLGNFFTIREVLEQFSGESLRYYILSSHYRSPLNHDFKLMQQAQESLSRWYALIRDEAKQASLESYPVIAADQILNENDEWSIKFKAAMDDDFNTPKALAVLHDLAHHIQKLKRESADTTPDLSKLIGLARVLGLLDQSPDVFFASLISEEETKKIEALIALRIEARDGKDWAKADQIRDQLLEMNVVIEDKLGQTLWRKK